MTENRRTRNFSNVERCEWCEDGWAVVAYRPVPAETSPDLPEYAPCPWCELGARLEFPTGEVTKKGYPPARAHWGTPGYWQGKPPAVERAPVSDSEPFTHAENTLRWRLILRRMGGAPVDPAAGWDVRDDAERIALLKAEAAK